MAMECPAEKQKKPFEFIVEDPDPNDLPFNPMRGMSTARFGIVTMAMLLVGFAPTLWGWVELKQVHAHLIQVCQVALFFFAVWLCGEIFTKLKGSALVGYMIAGIVLGPEVLNQVPYPGSFELFGGVGVMMLLGEAGLHMDISQVLESGKTAAWLTLLGMGVPWFGGMAVMMGLGFNMFASLAGGACFAPTSVGMATKILQDFGQLESNSGQMMITIAMVDDVLSLIVLAILVKLGESASGGKSASSSGGHLLATESPKLPEGPELAWLIIQPILYSTCFMIVGLFLIIITPTVYNGVVDGLLKRFPEGTPNHERAPLIFTLWYMLVFGLVFGALCGLLSTELLGVFMAGVAFSTLHNCHVVWTTHLKPLTVWLARLFFAAKIGFAVPVKTMLSVESFMFGLALSFPSVWGKVLTGLLVPLADKCVKSKNPTTWGEGWKIGWGRVGRGEFAFYMAQVSYSSGIMDPAAYACVVWALLISSLQFPFAFRFTMWYFTPKSPSPEERVDGDHHVLAKEKKLTQVQPGPSGGAVD